jgi:hypothetical protein
MNFLMYFACFGSVFALFASVIVGILWVLARFLQALGRFFRALIDPSGIDQHRNKYAIGLQPHHLKRAGQ